MPIQLTPLPVLFLTSHSDGAQFPKNNRRRSMTGCCLRSWACLVSPASRCTANRPRCCAHWRLMLCWLKIARNAIGSDLGYRNYVTLRSMRLDFEFYNRFDFCARHGCASLCFGRRSAATYRRSPGAFRLFHASRNFLLQFRKGWIRILFKWFSSV